ncbi:MAG: condensation domain-containing protein, partial [Gordonia sp. (in: high G+C Gram-positive bacteria)]|uniref:condensation domain-containing protein n=1 Tax=Gordonia sp. (in: high G+C Gram-positive bacteria) TaxID=84139 RepID=UPI003C72B7C1
SAPAGGEHLVAYLSPATVDVEAVRAAAAHELPGYMVPTVWTVRDDLALNSAGKIDRRALPEPDFGSVATEFVAPAGPREEALAAVFADVLGLDRVSVTESFFDVGGNSLSAMRLAARAGDALGTTISIREIFESPSVRALAAAAPVGGAVLPPLVATTPRPAQLPLSFAQQRMWFINQLDPSSAAYNIPAVLRLTGDLDVDALTAAVADVIARHEMLRTTFPAADGRPRQLIGDPAEFAARRVVQWTDTEAALFDAVAAGFDVAVDWPIRVRLWQAPAASDAADETILAVVLHHIAADGESLVPLVTDLVTAYNARSRGAAPEFAPLPVQVADFAIWQRAALGSPDDPTSIVGAQLGFWTRQLAGIPDVLDLPADRSRPAVASRAGARTGFVIPADVAARIETIARERGMTTFMVLHAALAVLLSRLSATDDIAVATPIAGRGDRALEPLVGMFVNTLVLRTPIASGESFEELLGRVRAIDLDSFAHADVPFEAVVDAVDPVRSEAFEPLAQVLLSVDPAAGLADTALTVGDLQISGVAQRVVPAQRDLTFEISAADGDWTGSLVYATDLFDEATA